VEVGAFCGPEAAWKFAPAFFEAEEEFRQTAWEDSEATPLATSHFIRI